MVFSLALMRSRSEHVRTLLFPEPELLKFLSTKAWKFQIILAFVVSSYCVFAWVTQDGTTLFYLMILLIFRCTVLLCGRFWSKSFITGCMACMVVDSACNIMAHPEMQTTVWLPFYESLLGEMGPPGCPELAQCFPNVFGTIIFGINLSYMLMFVVPFRCAACMVPPCFAAYVSCLVYSRSNNYVQFGELGDDVKLLTSREILLLSVILFLNVIAKLVMEISESDLWYALKDLQGNVLHEKILRCEAEYASECMKTVTTSSEKEHIPSSFCTTSIDGHHQTSKSATSAPPILETRSPKTFNEESVSLQFGAPCRGDCLQEDDVVWTTVPVKHLVKGQRVLCYDHLSTGLKHAEVLNVARHADSVQWATIVLTDGTSIRVTADHPFLTVAHGTTASLSDFEQVPVRASELEPNVSTVLVMNSSLMKLFPVHVQSVELDPPEELTEQVRVAIDIQQPTRHSVFVSRKDQSTIESAVAVGASNLEFMEKECALRCHNTFIHLFAEDPPLRRTTSSPGCLQSIPPSSAQSKDSSAKSISSPSTLSSEKPSVSADDCAIRIGATLRPVQDASGSAFYVASVHDGESQVGLQDYLRLKRSGLPSIGSFQHFQHGHCLDACYFENQRQHGRRRRCSAGLLCERCHFDHNFLKRGRRKL